MFANRKQNMFLEYNSCFNTKQSKIIYTKKNGKFYIFKINNYRK